MFIVPRLHKCYTFVLCKEVSNLINMHRDSLNNTYLCNTNVKFEYILEEKSRYFKRLCHFWEIFFLKVNKNIVLSRLHLKNNHNVCFHYHQRKQTFYAMSTSKLCEETSRAAYLQAIFTYT